MISPIQSNQTMLTYFSPLSMNRFSQLAMILILQNTVDPWPFLKETPKSEFGAFSVPRGGDSTTHLSKSLLDSYSRGQISEAALITQHSKMKQNREFIRRLESNIVELWGRNSSQFQEWLQNRTRGGCLFPLSSQFLSIFVLCFFSFFLLLLPPSSSFSSSPLPSPLLSLLFPPPPPTSLQPSPLLLIFLFHLKRIHGSFHFS